MSHLINKKGTTNLRQIRLGVFTLLIVAVCFASCNKQPVFNEFKLISPNGWLADSSCVFQLNIEDSVTLFDLTVNVRHTGAYPYQNLWLFVEQLSPDSLITRDTLSCTLSDFTGKWLGTGTGSVYLFSVPLKTKDRFKKTGMYQYTIVHGMRDENLNGIQAIGVKLDH